MRSVARSASAIAAPAPPIASSRRPARLLNARDSRKRDGAAGPRAIATATALSASRRLARPTPSPSSAVVAAASGGADGAPRVVEKGDMVTVHYTLYEEIVGGGEDGGDGGEAPTSSPPSPSTSDGDVAVDPIKKKKYRVLDSSREGDGRGEPLTFEVGAGDVFGNELFQAFDEVVRGRSEGSTVRLTCPSPPAWDPELLFRVPGDHPEIERMRGRYKNVGGLAEGLVVELSNGKRAVVVAESAEEVTLDANDMLAGGSGGERVFELEVVRVEAGKGAE